MMRAIRLALRSTSLRLQIPVRQVCLLITRPLGLYTDCFGTPSSPINYIVPANTTRVLSLKADIESTASFSTITANLSGNTSNLQGMTSSQSGSTSGVSGVALTLVNSSLSVSQSTNALGTQNVSAGTTNLRIGSYAFSASSAEGVNVNTETVQLTPGTTTPAFQNHKILVNGTQFGTTQGVVNGTSNYSFSGSAFSVPAGQTVNVDVYADTLSLSRDREPSPLRRHWLASLVRARFRSLR